MKGTIQRMTCRMCEATGELTKHHLLLRKARKRHHLPGTCVWLCRPCHDRLHFGWEGQRLHAHWELLLALDETERGVLALKPQLETWEARLRRDGIRLAHLPTAA